MNATNTMTGKKLHRCYGHGHNSKRQMHIRKNDDKATIQTLGLELKLISNPWPGIEIHDRIKMHRFYGNGHHSNHAKQQNTQSLHNSQEKKQSRILTLAFESNTCTRKENFVLDLQAEAGSSSS